MRTARLRLRPWSIDDLDALHHLFDDSAVRKYLFDDVAVTRERTGEILDMHLAQASGLGYWAIEIDGQMIGFVGVSGADGEYELMYALLPAYWGRGYATEAAQAVLDHVWASTAIETIHARTDPPNGKSVEVMERLGMERVGVEPGPEGQPLITYRLARPG